MVVREQYAIRYRAKPRLPSFEEPDYFLAPGLRPISKTAALDAALLFDSLADAQWNIEKPPSPDIRNYWDTPTPPDEAHEPGRVVRVVTEISRKVFELDSKPSWA